MLLQVHEAIRADPTAKPKARSKPAEAKRWKEVKLTYEQRKDKLKVRRGAWRAGPRGRRRGGAPGVHRETALAPCCAGLAVTGRATVHSTSAVYWPVSPINGGVSARCTPLQAKLSELMAGDDE